MQAGGSSSNSSEGGGPVLRTFVEGKEDGPTIVFVHGWPDDHTVWDKQVLTKRTGHLIVPAGEL